MLAGHFDDLGRPRILAVLVIPELAFYRRVDFLADTGASATALNYDDLRGVDLTGLPPPHPVGRGYGGTLIGQDVLGLLRFDEPDHGSSIYQLGLLLFNDETLEGLPSVLGRDVLEHLQMIHDPTNDILEFEIWRSDDFVPA